MMRISRDSPALVAVRGWLAGSSARQQTRSGRSGSRTRARQFVRGEELESQLGETERSEIRQAFERYAAKLLHPPLVSLRTESRSGSPHGLLEALKRLFDLRD